MRFILYFLVLFKNKIGKLILTAWIGDHDGNKLKIECSIFYLNLNFSPSLLETVH